MKNELEKMLKQIDDNKLIKINSNLYLTNYQINILNNNNIDYETSNSIRDLMVKIENIIDYEDNEELELLLDNLSERDYYENVNK